MQRCGRILRLQKVRHASTLLLPLQARGGVVGLPVNRSENMSRIRGRDTSPEIRLRQALWAAGVRYRLGDRVEGTRPDLVIRKSKLVVFVDGCFWHGCPLHYVRPRSNHGFWARKLRENVQRDLRQTAALEAAGWTVIRLWEHEVDADPRACAERIQLRAGSDEDWRLIEVVEVGQEQESRRSVELHNKLPPREQIVVRSELRIVGGHRKRK